jgi:hypothetical protein
VGVHGFDATQEWTVRNDLIVDATFAKFYMSLKVFVPISMMAIFTFL